MRQTCTRLIFVLFFAIPIVLAQQGIPKKALEPQDASSSQQFEKLFPKPPDITVAMYKAFPVQRITPRIQWSRPPRYGLDKNQNGIVDLPNSYEYVHNLPSWDSREGCPCLNDDCVGDTGGPQFRVYLDGRGTRFPPFETIYGRRPLISREETPPRTPRPQPPLDVNIPAEYAKLRANMRRLQWQIAGVSLSQPLTFDQPAADWWSPTQSVCLPEGDYTVTLKAVDNWTGEWNEVKRVISVEDIFIVQLGDSYGSGEGNPEKRIVASIDTSVASPYRQYIERHKDMILNWLLGLHADPDLVHVLWADDGGDYPWIDTASTVNLVGVGHVIPVPVKTRVPDYSKFSEMHRDHYRAHRSSFTASSQFALQVEEPNNKTSKSSVTYVNLAMSGATTNAGVLGPYAGRQGGNERFQSPNYNMDDQVLTLSRIAKRRKIDLLILTIGGNDSGFANLAVSLIMREQVDPVPVVYIGPDFETIRHGIHSGDWQAVANSTNFFEWVADWNPHGPDGLDKLKSNLSTLARRLAESNFSIDSVYVTEYPHAGVHFFADEDALGWWRRHSPNHYYCGQILNSLHPNSPPGGLEIDSEELEWLTHNFLGPLNETLRAAAKDHEEHGWRFLDGIGDQFLAHGLCVGAAPQYPEMYSPILPIKDRPDEGTMRYFRRESEAKTIEYRKNIENTIGTLHPNEYGHKAIMKVYLRQIRLPWIKDYTPGEDSFLP